MPRVVDHNEKKTEIIDAALRLIVRDGLAAASVRNIAAEAGCSARPVQYYFADKKALLAAAHARVTERLGARITAAVAGLGDAPTPRSIVEAVLGSFLPTDNEARDGMVGYYAFYVEEMLDPSVRIKGAAGAPNRLVDICEREFKRHHRDRPPYDARVEARMLLMALPNLATGVIAGYHSLSEAQALLTATLDRLLPAVRRKSPKTLGH